MSDGVTVDFSEVDKLATDLGTAAVKIGPTVESKVLTVLGAQLKSAAQSAAPVLTGALRGSIYLKGGKGYRTVGSNLKQGFFTEFGTSVMSPEPWLYPAHDKAAREMLHLLDNVADPLP